MMKRTTKKFLAVTLAATMMMGALAGCGAKKEAEGNDTKVEAESSVSVKSDENKAYTVSEYFAEKERVWLYLNDDSMNGFIDKSMQVIGIFVTNPDGTLIYTYGGSDAGLKTVGDYAQMSDDDIITFVKENPYEVRLDKHKQQYIGAETKEEIKEAAKQLKYKYSFNITTDSTGNSAESEQLVYQTYPDTVSVTDSQGNSVNPDYIDYESYVSIIIDSSIHMVNGSPIDSLSERINDARTKALFTFNFGMFSNMISFESIDRPVSSDIYDSHYAGFRTLDSNATNGMLVTKTDNMNVTYDSVGTENILIDKNVADIFGEEIVLTKEVNLFCSTDEDKTTLELGLNTSWDIAKLLDSGLINTIFEDGKMDKQRFKEIMDERRNNYGEESLSQETYDRLVAEGYIE